jgi:hypothetical protein
MASLRSAPSAPLTAVTSRFSSACAFVVDEVTVRCLSSAVSRTMVAPSNRFVALVCSSAMVLAASTSLAGNPARPPASLTSTEIQPPSKNAPSEGVSPVAPLRSSATSSSAAPNFSASSATGALAYSVGPITRISVPVTPSTVAARSARSSSAPSPPLS